MAFSKDVLYFALDEADYEFLSELLEGSLYTGFSNDFEEYVDPITGNKYYLAAPGNIDDDEWGYLADVDYSEVNFLRMQFINSTQASIVS
jgi:hypothetical protein